MKKTASTALTILLALLLSSHFALSGPLESTFEGDAETRKRLADLQDSATPPTLTLTDWINGESMTLDGLKGKIVVLDFWATWCGPCIASIPHTNKLQEEYRDKDVVIIGICHPRGSEKMAEVVKDKGIKYPVAKDPDGKTIAAYNVNGFPDYYIIDRKGVLRVADCSNSQVETAIKTLLEED